MPKDPHKPAKHELPLAGAFIEMMRPSPELVEEAHRKAEARGGQDWRVALFGIAASAARDIESARDVTDVRAEAARLWCAFAHMMAVGEAIARGHVGSPAGPKRDLPPQAWPYIRYYGYLEVDGAPPVRFYEVTVVATRTKRRKRGHPGYYNELLMVDMHRIVLDAQRTGARSPERGAAGLLIADDRVRPLAEHESMVRRLCRHYAYFLRTKFRN